MRALAGVRALPPRAGGHAGRELLDRRPAAERHGRAAHGPRAQRLDPGHARPLPPHARAARRSGSSAPTTPGIATQKQVEKPLEAEGTSREAIGPRGVRRRACGSGASEYGGTIIEQFKRLGASLDYEDERFTLDERYATAVLKVFVDLYDKGSIYRDNYMVNWDPGCRLGDLRPRGRGARGRRHAVPRSPTRSSDGERRARRRHGAPRDDAGRHRRRRAPRRRALPPPRRPHGDPAARRPRACRSSPTSTSRPSSAPAALKITPGPRPQRLRDRPPPRPARRSRVIGEDGRMTDGGGRRYAGLTVLEARERVVADLEATARSARREPYRHTVPFSHRSGERIEPLISLQWFMRMDELAGPAIDGGARGPRAHPPRAASRRRYVEWLENIRPGASRASCGGATRSPSGTAASETYVGIAAAGGRGLGARPRRARHLVLLGAVAVRDARLAARTRPSCAPSTRPTCSRRRATSSSCGWRGW